MSWYRVLSTKVTFRMLATITLIYTTINFLVRKVVHNFPHPGRIACCSTPNSRPPATKALHTICGNNTIIVSSSWWWAYECPKHVEQIIIAINHSVASSWFSSLRLYYDARTNITSHSQGDEDCIWTRKKGAKRESRKMQMVNIVLGPYHQTSSGFSNEGRYDGRGVGHVRVWKNRSA